MINFLKNLTMAGGFLLLAIRGAPTFGLDAWLASRRIVPLRDPFLTPAVYDDLPQLCSDLTRHDIDAGHWVQQSHPDEVAWLIRDFAGAHERNHR